jgi:hypothetical protein
MELIYKLVGYDHETDRLSYARDIPAHRVPLAKRVAGLPEDDPEAIGDRPLSRGQAREIAGLIGADIDTDRMDFFLEPYNPHPLPRSA